MIHQPLGGAKGQAAEIEIRAKRILRLKDHLNELLSERTGQSLSTIKKTLIEIHSLQRMKQKNMA